MCQVKKSGALSLETEIEGTPLFKKLLPSPPTDSTYYLLYRFYAQGERAR
jgi:hypothetical protein